MKTISKEEMDKFLVSIGGLESGVRTDIGPLTDAYVFSVSPGWYGLIKNLIEELIAVGWDKQITQVKEKFGSLRFYTGGLTDEQREIVRRYENLSTETCEKCGAKGKIESNHGWLSCVCEEHKSIK